jgi:serine/threonine protein phosphatase PrpC
VTSDDGVRHGDEAPPEPTADAPPRATWTSTAPQAPWCPDDWRGALQRAAPGLFLPDESAHQPHADAIGSRLSADGWTVVLASRRGRVHAHRGEHREDAGSVLHFAGGWCVAVADGAGSAPWSRLGSAIATHAVTHALREALAHGQAPADALAPALQAAARMAHDALRTFARDCELALRDLRTTLLVTTLHRGHVGVMQVGDGAMALLMHGERVVHPHTAATGDYSGEVSHFLPDDGALEVLEGSISVHDGDALQGVLLASDGVDDPWYPFTRRAAALYATLLHGWREQWAPAGFVPAWRTSVLDADDPVHALTEWLAFEQRGENDDRTLCVVRRDGTSWPDTAA